jgi:diphthamide synthase subunit DPH2
VHHLASGILDAASSATSSSSPGSVVPSSNDQSVKVAIIAAIGLVFSVSIPLLVSTFNRSRAASPVPEETAVEKELRRRAEAAESIVHDRDLEIKQRVRGSELRDEKIDQLEALLWSRGIDPKTAIPVLLPQQIQQHDSS